MTTPVEQPPGAKCACKPTCRFKADPGHAYFLSHDPTSERQEERQRMMAERGRAGRAQVETHRQAAREESAVKLSVRTIEGQLATLDILLRNLMRAKLDAAKVAAAGGQLVKIAREVLASAELEQENRDLKKLIDEKFPDLRRQLKAAS